MIGLTADDANLDRLAQTGILYLTRHVIRGTHKCKMSWINELYHFYLRNVSPSRSGKFIKASHISTLPIMQKGHICAIMQKGHYTIHCLGFAPVATIVETGAFPHIFTQITGVEREW